MKMIADLNQAQKKIFSWKMINHFTRNLSQHFLSAEKLLSELKTYITIFNEKFQNQCKEQTNNKVPSKIFPLCKASS